MMDNWGALLIIRDLAIQNFADKHEKPDEYAEQMEALALFDNILSKFAFTADPFYKPSFLEKLLGGKI